MPSMYATLFKNLSLHDADLLDVLTCQNQEGDWMLNISVRTESGRFRLAFNNCRYLKVEIKGGVATADVVVNTNATAESTIFKKAGEWPAPLGGEALHYSFMTNSGSTIDVVAEHFKVIPEN